MASLTINGIPPGIMDRLTPVAQTDRRIIDQQGNLVLERSLRDRPSFGKLYAAFLEEHGPLDMPDGHVENLRSKEKGRSVKFEDVDR